MVITIIARILILLVKTSHFVLFSSMLSYMQPVIILTPSQTTICSTNTAEYKITIPPTAHYLLTSSLSIQLGIELENNQPTNQSVSQSLE